MDNCPMWLKSMQNGSIGEMRTKAFLIDRFWILERSVDIHGGDTWDGSFCPAFMLTTKNTHRRFKHEH